MGQNNLTFIRVNNEISIAAGKVKFNISSVENIT